MRTKLTLLIALVALVAAGAALAGSPKRNAAPFGIHYAFLGQLTAVPANGGVSIDVVGGNRPALRAMLGQSVSQTFAFDSSTEFLRWAKGVPTVVQPGDLAVGDYVRVNVRAPRGALLADIEERPSPLVGDHGTQLYKPTRPLYLFRGKLDSVNGSSVVLDVRGGNARAVRLLLGQPTTQSFSTGNETIFLLWQGKVPTVISIGQLKIGDRVIVRIRAPKGSTLTQVESTAAVHVGDREPA
jgi:hypothetical protein